MKKYVLVPVNQHDTEHQQLQPGMSQEDILSSIPVSYRNKARTLLNCIINSSQLTWNKRGEIMQGEQTVHGSHIIDLLKYTLYPYKHFMPVGFDQFNSTLQAINIPRSLIQQSGCGVLPPPGVPGIGVKNNSKWVWHKM